MTAPLDTAQARALVRDVFEDALAAAEERDELKRENARLRENIAEALDYAGSLMEIIGTHDFSIGAEMSARLLGKEMLL